FEPAAEILRRFSTNTVSLRGTALDGGEVVLAAGIVMAVAAAVMMIVRSGTARRAVAVVAIVAAVGGGGIALLHLRGADHFAIRAVHQVERAEGRTAALGRSDAAIERTLARRDITASRTFGPGIFLALVGAVIGLIGATAVAIGGSGTVSPAEPRPTDESRVAARGPVGSQQAA
ncbi:MAG: hypothetical protein ABR518_05690, partial [Actinomycetota bacterium]